MRIFIDEACISTSSLVYFLFLFAIEDSDSEIPPWIDYSEWRTDSVHTLGVKIVYLQFYLTQTIG